MNNLSLVSIVRTLALLCFVFLQTTVFSQDNKLYQANKFKVKFTSGNSKSLNEFEKSAQKRSKSGSVITGLASIDALNETFHVQNIKRVFPYSKTFEARHEQFGLHLWYEFEMDASKSNDISKCISSFQADKNIQLCEPVYTKVLYDERVNSVITDSTNDPRIHEQWHYNNYGQTGGTVDADISLREAWQIEAGSSNVIVAVIDGGVDYTHEDLSNAMWINEKEKNGTAGIDDDENGYIDDIYGYGFGDYTGNYSAGDHGTHVGGTIGAVNNNGIGVAGIAGGNNTEKGVRLMSCATFGSYNNDGFDKAFVYAADNGAVIAQNSWGYGGYGYYEQSVLDAIDYFIANAGYDADGKPNGPMQGGLVIFSAGNDNNDADYYPGYYEPVLSVSATNHNDVKSWYSNYGTWVDIAAPGGETYTSYQGVLSTLPGNNYGFYQGTSMACPHVSGVAALIVSKYGDNGLTPDLVKDRLTLTVDDIDINNPAYIGKLGSGRLNAYTALLQNDEVAPNAITDLSIIDSSQISLTINWTATGFSADSGTASRYEFRYASFELTSENFETATLVKNMPKPKPSGSLESYTINKLNAETKYWMAIKASDYYGNKSTISNVISATTKDAPIISLSPDKIVHAVDSGKVDTILVSISNIGKLDLDFTFPAFSQVTSTVKSSSIKPSNFGDDGPDGFGYRWKDSDASGGPSYNWIDITETGKPIALYDNDYKKVDLPFNFPFYGESKNYICISSNGYLAFNEDNPTNSYNDNIPYYGYPNEFIALYWDDLDPSDGGEIYYYGDEEKFIVQYQAVLRDYYGEAISCQAILYRSGRIKLQYNTLEGYNNSATVGIENSTGSDGLQIAYNQTYLKNNLAIDISNASLFISEINPSTGTLKTDEVSQIKIVVKANELGPDNYNDSILIASNDSLNAELYWPIQLHVNGIPNLEVDNNNIDFGNSFINYKDSLFITITNSGTDSLHISDIVTTNTAFYFNTENKAFSLYKNETKTFPVFHTPLEEITYSDSIIFYNNSDSSQYVIKVNSAGIYPPVFNYSPDSIGYVLHVGDSVTTALLIDNTEGLSDLEFEINITNYKSAAASNNNTKIGFYADESRKTTNQLNTPTGAVNNIQTTAGNIIGIYDNIPVANTGIVIIDNYAYFVVYEQAVLLKFNLDTKLVEDTYYIHSYPYGIAYDGAYLWIGNPNGNIYGYTLTGTNIGSFSCPESSLNAITFNGSSFTVCNIYNSHSTIYEIDYDNSIINSTNSDLPSVNQFAFNSSSNNLYCTVDDQIYQIGMDEDIITILDTVTIPVVIGNNVYSIYSQNNLLWMADWYGPLYEIDVFSTEWLSLETHTGIINAGEDLDINTYIHTENMIAGLYTKNISITSNDPNHTGTLIPVHIEVHGDPKIAVSSDSVIFDSTYVGVSYYQNIRLTNNGSDTLKISDLVSSNSDFSIDSVPQQLLPNEYYNLEIMYLPSSAEYDTGSLSIHSNDTTHAVYEIALEGHAVMPPVLATNVDSLYANLYSGDSTVQVLTINNTGGSKLQWELDYEYIFNTDTASTFASKSAQHPELDSSVINTFIPLANSPSYLCCLAIDPNTGYIYAQQEDGYEYYRYLPDSDVWETLTSCPIYSSSNGGAVYLNGKIYNSYYSHDILSIYDIALNTWTYETSGLGYTGNIATDGKLLYFRVYTELKSYNPNTKTWVSLSNSTSYATGTNGLSYYKGFLYSHSNSYSFQKYSIVNDEWIDLESIPLNCRLGSAIDPNEEKYYAAYSENLMAYDIKTDSWETYYNPYFYSNDAGIVYNGIAGQHGIYVIEGEYGTGFAKFQTSPPFDWLSIQNLTGEIEPNGSMEIDINFNASNLPENIYLAEITLRNNDPFMPNKTIPVSLNITGAANISLSKDSVYFESAFVNYTISDSITIFNRGTEKLIIDSIYMENKALFELSDISLEIEPEAFKTIGISFTAENVQTYETKLFFQSNAQPENLISINISANGKIAPRLNLSSEELTVYAMPNQIVDRSFSIANNGGSNLEYNIFATETKNIDQTSIKYFYNSGEDTEHIFTDLNEGAEQIKLIITLNGDYSSYTYEYAELEIDGLNFGQINNEYSNDGYDYVKEFTFSGDTLSQMLADGSLTIYIRNSPDVNYGYGESKNQVQLIMDGKSWFQIGNASGVLEIKDSVSLHTQFNSKNLSVGDYHTAFTINSNDPENESVEVPVTLKVRDQSPPIVVNPISDMIHYISEKTVEIDITNVFLDVNNDALLYSVNSSNIGDVFASISNNSILKLQLLNTGASEIKLLARDNNFDPVSTSFSILVLDNSAPEIVTNINNTNLKLNDDPLQISFSQLFYDKENDSLKYSYTNSDTAIAKGQIVDKSQLLLTPKSLGSTTITISADDSKGGIAHIQFVLSVADNNSPLVINPIANKTVYLTQKLEPINIDSVFLDADGDQMDFTLINGDSSIVIARLIENIIVFEKIAAGKALITLQASDSLSVTNTSFTVTLLENSAPKLVNVIADMRIPIDTVNFSILLNNYFSDADNDILSYSIFTSNDTISDWSLVGSELKIVPSKTGITNYLIIASDNKSEPINTWFTLTVTNATEIYERESLNGLKVYPNPFTDEINMNFTLEIPGKVIVNIYSMEGKLVATDNLGFVGNKEVNYKMDINQLKESVYYIQLRVDNEIKALQKIIKK